MIYFGWHSLSSVGHLITMISIVFMFLVFFDSIILNNVFTPNYFHLARTNKRVLFYLFKINSSRSFKNNSNFFFKNHKNVEYDFYKI